MTAVTACRYCHQPIRLRRIRGGYWVPFDLNLTPADAGTVDAYVPTRTTDVVVFVPVGDVSQRRMAGVRWYAHRHRCAEYLRSAADKRYNVDRLADLLGGQ